MKTNETKKNKELRQWTVGMSEERIFEAEGVASARALREGVPDMGADQERGPEWQAQST